MNRILVIRGGAIGDFVLTLPAIELLRNRWPLSYLEILGYKHITVLAENRFYGNATRSIEYSQLARFFAKGSDLPHELAGYFGSFDLIVSYLSDPDLIFETNLRRCGKFELIVGPSRPNESSHAAMQLAMPLREINLHPGDCAAKLFPSADDREFAQTFHPDAQGLFGIHPGSGSTVKNWPLPPWQAFASRLLESSRALSLVIFGGEADQLALQELRQKLPRERVIFAENLPLPHVAAVIERCPLFVGHDSGISHIAAAVGTPTLLLFGPTNPDVWAPISVNTHVLRSADKQMTSISVAEVMSTAVELVAAGRGRNSC